MSFRRFEPIAVMAVKVNSGSDLPRKGEEVLNERKPFILEHSTFAGSKSGCFSAFCSKFCKGKTICDSFNGGNKS